LHPVYVGKENAANNGSPPSLLRVAEALVFAGRIPARPLIAFSVPLALQKSGCLSHRPLRAWTPENPHPPYTRGTVWPKRDSFRRNPATAPRYLPTRYVTQTAPQSPPGPYTHSNRMREPQRTGERLPQIRHTTRFLRSALWQPLAICYDWTL